MSKWSMVPLGEVLEPVSRPEPVNPEKTYRVLGARWYAHGLYTKETLTGTEIRAPRIYRVAEGDFVYNRLFAWKGSFAVATQDNHGCYVSNEFPCFRVRPDRLHAKYLWRYFSCEQAWTEALGLSKGGTPTSRNRLKEEAFLRLTIPLPPLDEQRRLVGLIDAVAVRVEEARKIREEANAQRQALVTSLHLHLANSSVRGMDTILTLDEDREEVQPGRQYPQVGIRGFGEGLFPREQLEATETTYKAFNRLYEGAVVLSQVKGWEGAIAVCGADLAGRYASPEYRTFSCWPDAAIPEYLAAVFATPWFWSQLKGLTRGVGARRERIRPERFLQMSIPMPTIEKQRTALEVIKKCGQVKTIQATTLTRLEAIMPAVLNRTFNESP